MKDSTKELGIKREREEAQGILNKKKIKEKNCRVNWKLIEYKSTLQWAKKVAINWYLKNIIKIHHIHVVSLLIRSIFMFFYDKFD